MYLFRFKNIFLIELHAWIPDCYSLSFVIICAENGIDNNLYLSLFQQLKLELTFHYICFVRKRTKHVIKIFSIVIHKQTNKTISPYLTIFTISIFIIQRTPHSRRGGFGTSLFARHIGFQKLHQLNELNQLWNSSSVYQML